MSNKILIVGGCGYVGGYLTDLLFKNDYDVTVYDDILYETRFLKKVKFIRGDIRNTEKLQKILPSYDTVIWLAALVGDPACAVDPNLTRQINYDTVKWLVDNYKKRIVFLSTCSVYGVNNDLIDETATPNPLSAYASTKLEAEQYIVKNHPNHLIFRLGTLYGLGDEHSRLRLDLVVNVLVKKAIEGEKLSVFGGEQWRPLLHVKDVSHGILHGLEQNITGLYNLSERNVKIYEIAEQIKKYITTAEVEFQDMKFQDLRNYKVSGDKYYATGWRPIFNLDDGIMELKRVFEDQRIKNLNDIIYSNGHFIKHSKNGGTYGACGN
jgi:nucleoside-diphosphate-sugar epimerase